MIPATRTMVILSALGAFGGGLSAQGTAPSKPRPSLQQQIDDLRDGQALMLKELEALKALLKERGARSEGPQRPPAFATVNVFGEPFRGEAKARVAILEYSDFDCTFCARYATEIFPRINAHYLKTGKVKYFYRDYPSPEHRTALSKALLARCAGEQGKFWEAHDRLFEDQKTFDLQDLSAFTRALEVDPAQLQACMGSERYVEPIRRSGLSAERLGIRGTPAFLIGRLSDDGNVLTATKIFLGAESYEAFQKLLDELLAPPTEKP